MDRREQMVRQWMGRLSHKNPWEVAFVYKSALGWVHAILIVSLWILCWVLAGWWGVTLGWITGAAIQMVMAYIINNELNP